MPTASTGRKSMKKSFAIAALLPVFLCAAPAMADCANNTTVGGEGGRQFAEQDFTLHRGATLTVDDTFTCDVAEHWKVYGNWWRGQTDTAAHNEEDRGVGGIYRADEHTTWDTSVYQFKIDGPDAYRVRLMVHHDFDDHWAVEVNGDVIWGGFETEVLRAQVFRSDPLAWGFSSNLRAGLSFDTWSGDAVFQWGAGVSHPFVFGTTLNLSAQGYQGLTGGHDGQTNNDAMGLVSVNIPWH